MGRARSRDFPSFNRKGTVQRTSSKILLSVLKGVGAVGSANGLLESIAVVLKKAETKIGCKKSNKGNERQWNRQEK